MSTSSTSGAPRPATIHDVAELAGVATSTVSRALSMPDRVNFRTRERIERAAAQLHYVPSKQARALTSGRTGAVALLVPDITNPFYFDIVRGAQWQLKAAGYTQLLVDTEESEEVESATLAQLRKSADGVVLAASRLSDTQLADTARSIPLVTLNRPAPGASTVIIDTPAATGQALDHLVSLGHRTIAYVAGPDGSWSNARRWETLDKATEAHGTRIIRIGPFAPTQHSGAAATDSVLASGATACIVFNDLIAIGMLRRIRERGLTIPDDLSIVGCDDIFGADFCHPPLTTVTAPVERAGRTAITMLLSQIEPQHAPLRNQSVLPTYLTIRASTGPAPVAAAGQAIPA